MTWTRLDDAWTDLPVLADMTLAARWHYLCLIQFCSRSGNYDGLIRTVDALRCSDVDKPKDAMNEIHRAGLLARTDDPKRLRLVQIDDHVPPESVREKAVRDRDRKERSRRHAAGDHSTCYRQRCEHGQLDEPKPKRHATLPEGAPVNSPVKSHVTPGLDGTGRVGSGSTYNEAHPEHIDKTTGEVFEFPPGDPWHGQNGKGVA